MPDEFTPSTLPPRRDRVEEKQAAVVIRRLAAEIAEQAAIIWCQGDGEGGYVRSLIEEALSPLVVGRAPTPTGKGQRRRKIPPLIRQAVYERDAYRCVEPGCGSWIDLTLDHYPIPWSRGGPDTVDNLRTMCLTHNREKGDQ
jgi:hypothetical protein